MYKLRIIVYLPVIISSGTKAASFPCINLFSSVQAELKNTSPANKDQGERNSILIVTKVSVAEETPIIFIIYPGSIYYKIRKQYFQWELQ